MKFSASLALSALYASAALAGPVLRVRQDDSNDDDLLSSPTNGTSIAPGGNISFTFRTNDDDTDAVRVALVQVREIARDLPVTNREVTQNIALPADLAPGTYFLAISERERQGTDDDDDDDDDDDNDSSGSSASRRQDRYDDYDYSFETPTSSDEVRVYLTVANTTTA